MVGHWPRSPIGPMADVMWVTPEGERRLLAPSAAAAELVCAVYAFDDVRVGPLAVSGGSGRTAAVGHGLELELVGGRRRAALPRRPLAVTRWLEAPVARRLMGVETYGTSPTGAREWYQASGWRWLVGGRAVLDGRDLGRPGPVAVPLGVGFSEPPRRPSIVGVRVTVELARPR